MMKRIWIGCAVLAAAVFFTACSGNDQPRENTVRASIVQADDSVRQTVLFANPQGAAREIYASLDNEPALTELDAQSLEDVFGIAPGQVEDFVAYVSDPKSGLSDVVMIQPADEDAADEVRLALLNYQSACIEQYRNYDILSSLSIAQNATVYTQGDYIVFLMTADNEEAQDIVDRYMPQ